jgi:hypothetical protein
MTSSHIAVPPPKAVQAALSKITETLASELARPTDIAPDWSDFEWLVARAVAAIHGVSPLLSSALHWQGPPGWVQFLEEQRAHTVSRHRRIGELLHLIDTRARAEGLAMLALKGVALHAIGLYAAGERPMADVDLLVRDGDLERSAKLLESLAFHESFACWKHRVLAPDDGRAPGSLGEHSGNNIKIELHGRIGERLPLRATDISELVFPPRPHPGLNAYPSKASLMIHLLLHAAGAMASRTLRLLHLHDLALLSLHLTSADWDEVLGQGADDRGPWWALPPLHLTARYYSSAVPPRVLTTLGSECSWLLGRIALRKTLSDVSLSYLWISAFPGIEWSQSVPEMLRYAVSRVLPSEEELTLRENVARNEAWASQSQSYNLSHSRRMLRWVTSRPTRAATMHVVRATFAQAQ